MLTTLSDHDLITEFRIHHGYRITETKENHEITGYLKNDLEMNFIWRVGIIPSGVKRSEIA